MVLIPKNINKMMHGDKKTFKMRHEIYFHKLIQSPHKSSAYGHINVDESLQESDHIPLSSDVYIPEDIYDSP